MTDPTLFSSTPQGYMTPDQIKQLYEYSGALTKGGMRDDTITSPWQGARMMMDALSGNIMRNRAGGQQLNNLNQDATRTLQPSIPGSIIPGSSTAPPPPGMPGVGTPTAGLPPNNVLPGMGGPNSNMMTALMTPPPV